MVRRLPPWIEAARRPMRHSLRWAVMLLALAAVPPISAQAQTGLRRPSRSAPHRDWSVYEVTDSRGRICYIASEPTAQSGNYRAATRRPSWSPACPALQPARRSASSRATPTARTARSTVSVDGRLFKMFTDGEHAWTRTNDEDRTLIAAMKGGVSMTVRHLDPRHLFPGHLFAAQRLHRRLRCDAGRLYRMSRLR